MVLLSMKMAHLKALTFLVHFDIGIHAGDIGITRGLPKWLKMASTEKGHVDMLMDMLRMAQLFFSFLNYVILAFSAYDMLHILSLS